MSKDNREILFRGFHPCENGDTTIHVEGKAVKGRWVEGVPCGEYMICGVTMEYYDDEVPESIHPEFDYVEIIPATVGWYTGLTDKNGAKIFEGDILRNDVGNNGVIKYGIVPENLGWNGVPHIAFYAEWNWEDVRPDLPHWINRAEVIGTIWDKERQDERD